MKEEKSGKSHDLTCEGIPANSPVFMSSSTCSRTATGLHTDIKLWTRQRDSDGHDHDDIALVIRRQQLKDSDLLTCIDTHALTWIC